MSEKETRPMPQGRSGARGKARGPKNAKLTIKRLLSYIKAYKIQFIFVIICIIISAAVNVKVSNFI